jgi:hypothetical protein
MSPGDGEKPGEFSQATINQVVGGLQSAPLAEATTTGVASAVRGLGAALTPSQSISADPLSSIWRALDDMTIPPPLVQQLEPLLKEIGLTLEADSVPDPDDATKAHRFTNAVGLGTAIAVLHLPGSVLRMPQAVGVFRHSLSNIWSRHGRVISETTDWVQPGIRKGLQIDPPPDRSWMFVQWGDLESVFNGQVKIENALALSALLPNAKKNGVAAPAPAAGTLDDDIKDIIAIFVKQAIVTKEYFEGLVDKSDWSDSLKGKVQGALTGDPNKDAQALINILRAANLYAANHANKGDTFLGWLLLRELDGLGDPDGATLAKIIVARGLVQQKEGLAKAKARLAGGD